MQLFGRQYSNFLRFYSNLLDAVFLLYDLTHLLSRVQWQVMQCLIDFHHPPPCFNQTSCAEVFFHHRAVYNNYFCLLFPPCCAGVPIPYSSPQPEAGCPSHHTALLPTSAYPALRQPQPSPAVFSLSSPNPARFPPAWGRLG